MSRICVKHLPLKAKEDDLRNFFSQKGEVTDVKIIRTADGKSRQFGFIGYRTPQEAEQAISYFNKSFMGASRIFCEIAHKVGDPNIPRPWSRHSKEKQEKIIKEGKEVHGGQDSSKKGSKDSTHKKSDVKDDPKLEEFLQVMQPRSKSKLWADDTLVAPSVDKTGKVIKPSSKADIEQSKLKKASLNESSQEDQELEKHQLEDSSNHAHDDISDADYFRSKIKRDWSESDADENNDCEVKEHSDQNGERKIKTEKHVSFEGQDDHNNDHYGELIDSENPSVKDTNEESFEAGRLFVRNLPYTTTEDDLKEFFIRFGDIADIRLVVDKETKRCRGIGYVLYQDPGSAARALQELDHSDFQGRILHIMPAKSKPSSQNQVTSDSMGNTKTFKQKREENKKASEVGGDTRSWNTLFMRSDTIAENIARKYGVSKSELLDREASDLAVRIAAGETEIVSETKKALASAGVNTASLEDFASGKTDGVERSNYVILVKNLPYNTIEADLMEMFGKYGSLDKVILPPTRTIALVVYLESGEAQTAFRNLAYKRYKHVPLYLEWAPSNILNPDSVSHIDGKNYAIGENEAKKVLLQEEIGMVSDDIDPDKIESRSLFVKNLNFKTTEESLRKHLSENIKDGKAISVRIKKHVKNGKNVSMGFGFVEFDSAETAANACKDLQGTVLDSHALILQHSRPKRNQKVDNKVENDLSSTKLIVRNVAFEATEKELRQLFSLYGQVKSLRLPKKLGNHRGFAFVEYSTKQETQKALQSLSSSHFYGRHLVLERAKEGESLEELRVRTAAHYSEEPSGGKSSKRRKVTASSDGGDF